MNVIGIKRETHLEEFRTPLTPSAVKKLVSHFPIYVQSSRKRIFSDLEYKQAGAKIVKTMKDCNVILGIKEVAIKDIYSRKTYLFFSHTTKGQPQNMKMLKTLIERKCHLIDYEEIQNTNKESFVRFGELAGQVGAIQIFKKAAKCLYKDEFLYPFIVGIIGNGHITKGVLKQIKQANFMELLPKALKTFIKNPRVSYGLIYFVIFNREHTRDFSQYLPYLSVLINAATWKSGNPKFVTEKSIHQLYMQEEKLRLKLIADIVCDIDNGGIDIVKKVTTFKKPFYYWNPETNRITIRKKGIMVMAIDNLPGGSKKHAKTASIMMSDALFPLLLKIAKINFNSVFIYDIPHPIWEAMIVHNGVLTPKYKYLQGYTL